MMRYEYKVVPAPARGEKAKGVKAPEARFALTVEQVLNEMGADGWEFLRAETLPSEERQGLTGWASHWLIATSSSSSCSTRRPHNPMAAATSPKLGFSSSV